MFWKGCPFYMETAQALNNGVSMLGRQLVPVFVYGLKPHRELYAINNNNGEYCTQTDDQVGFLLRKILHCKTSKSQENMDTLEAKSGFVHLYIGRRTIYYGCWRP